MADMYTTLRDLYKPFYRANRILGARHPEDEPRRSSRWIGVARFFEHTQRQPSRTMAIFSVVSTLLQGLIVVLGGFVTIAYSFSSLRQTVERRGGVGDWKSIFTQMVFSLCLVGLYGVFVYIFALEEMSEGGFRTLAEMLGG